MSNPAAISPGLSPDTVITVAPDQVSCDLGEETVILSVRQGTYFGLNAVGTLVWELAQTPRSVAELGAAVAAAYPDVDSEQCARDVAALLAQLAQLGLVTVPAAPVEA